MRTIITETTIYNFNELSPEAKEKVKQWYLEGQEAQELEKIHLEYLGEKFPKSDLKIQFDMSCCQGSGYNIYGSVNFDDVLNYCERHNIETGLTEKETKALKFYDNEGLLPINLKQNRRYTYYCQSCRDITYDIDYELEDNGFWLKNINYAAIEKLAELVDDIFADECKKLYEKAYAYFYEIDDDDLAEICDVNNWEFTADGKIV